MDDQEKGKKGLDDQQAPCPRGPGPTPSSLLRKLPTPGIQGAQSTFTPQPECPKSCSSCPPYRPATPGEMGRGVSLRNEDSPSQGNSIAPIPKFPLTRGLSRTDTTRRARGRSSQGRLLRHQGNRGEINRMVLNKGKGIYEPVTRAGAAGPQARPLSRPPQEIPTRPLARGTGDPETKAPQFGQSLG